MISTEKDSTLTMGVFLKSHSFIGFEDIEAITANPKAKKKLESVENHCYSINIKDVSARTVKVGKLLQTAYAGSQNYPCGGKVLQALLSYKPFITKMLKTSRKLSFQGLITLQRLKTGADFLDKNNIQETLGSISQCSETAEKMAKSSKKIVLEAKKVYAIVEEATVKASEEKSLTIEERKKIKEQINDLKIRQAKQEKNKEVLAKHKLERKKLAHEMSKKEGTARRQAFALKLISATMVDPVTEIGRSLISPFGSALASLSSKHSGREEDNPFSELIRRQEAKRKEIENLAGELAEKKIELENAQEGKKEEVIITLKKDIGRIEAQLKEKSKTITEIKTNVSKLGDSFETRATALEQKAQEINDKITELEKSELVSETELAVIVESLKTADINKNKLARVVACLQIIINSLAEICSTLQDIETFWDEVKENCKDLTKIKDLTKTSELETESVRQNLMEMAWYSLTVTKINVEALNAMKDASKGFSQILENLPDKEESNRIIEEFKNTYPKKPSRIKAIGQ